MNCQKRDKMTKLENVKNGQKPRNVFNVKYNSIKSRKPYLKA